MKRNVEVNPAEEVSCLLARARVATPGTIRVSPHKKENVI